MALGGLELSCNCCISAASTRLGLLYVLPAPTVSFRGHPGGATSPRVGRITYCGCGTYCRISEMHSQADDQAIIIRLGFNEVRAHLGIRDAIPDARNIEREAFVEIAR